MTDPIQAEVRKTLFVKNAEQFHLTKSIAEFEDIMSECEKRSEEGYSFAMFDTEDCDYFDSNVQKLVKQEKLDMKEYKRKDSNKSNCTCSQYAAVTCFHRHSVIIVSWGDYETDSSEINEKEYNIQNLPLAPTSTTPTPHYHYPTT